MHHAGEEAEGRRRAARRHSGKYETDVSWSRQAIMGAHGSAPAADAAGATSPRVGYYVPDCTSGGTTNHLPPTFWPVVSPGLVSFCQKYSGQPLYVTCIPPFGLATVPSVPVTPFSPAGLSTPVGSSSGGHACRQAARHVTFPVPLSGV